MLLIITFGIIIYLYDLKTEINKLKMEQEQLALDLLAVSATLAAFKADVTEKLEILQAEISAADDVKPELQSAFDSVKAVVDSLPVINPTPEPTPEVTV